MFADPGISRPNAADEDARKDFLDRQRPERDFPGLGPDGLRDELHYFDRRIAELQEERAKVLRELERLTQPRKVFA